MQASILEDGSDSEVFSSPGTSRLDLNSKDLSCGRHNRKDWQCLEVSENEVSNALTFAVSHCYNDLSILGEVSPLSVDPRTGAASATLCFPVAPEACRRPSWRPGSPPYLILFSMLPSIHTLESCLSD